MRERARKRSCRGGGGGGVSGFRFLKEETVGGRCVVDEVVNDEEDSRR